MASFPRVNNRDLPFDKSPRAFTHTAAPLWDQPGSHATPARASLSRPPIPAFDFLCFFQARRKPGRFRARLLDHDVPLQPCHVRQSFGSSFDIKVIGGGKLQPPGMTPATVYGVPSSVTDSPSSRGSTEPPAPESLAHDGRMLTPGDPSFGQKISPERGPYIQHPVRLKSDR